MLKPSALESWRFFLFLILRFSRAASQEVTGACKLLPYPYNRGIIQATVTSQVTIAASPAEVFVYLAEPKYHYLWSPHLLNIATDQPLQLGTRYTAENRVFGVVLTAENEVTTFSPPHELTLENTTGNVRYKLHFRLSGIDGATTVQLSTSLSTDLTIFKLTRPLLKDLILREFHTELEALKIAVENKLE